MNNFIGHLKIILHLSCQSLRRDDPKGTLSGIKMPPMVNHMYRYCQHAKISEMFQGRICDIVTHCCNSKVLNHQVPEVVM